MDIGAIHEHICDIIKKDSVFDFRCTDCGVGINGGEETFIVKPKTIQIMCKTCVQEHGL